MKKIIVFLLLLISLRIETSAQTNVFSKGINLTNWFQTNGAGQIHFTKYTKSDFEDIKSLGVDVIRLPINLHSMVTNNIDYSLDPLFLFFLDQVIDWAEELELHLILDNHTFDPSASTSSSIKEILIPVWKNMALHYKDRSNLIYFEVLNEPHGISDALWNSIQGEVIDAIREIDTIHTIIVGPSGFNSFHNLKNMPTYSDDNLIYTFHFYDPFIFTHQGASWTDPSMSSLANVPFPYNQNEMPSIPTELIGTWINSSLNNYQNEGTIGKVIELLDIAVEFQTERGVPLFCGEFGVLMNNADNTDRILWYTIVRNYLELQGISWTIWDYHGSFGIYEQFGNDLFDHDLNTKLLEALGFNVPPQTEFIVQPDTSGFTIYSDFICEKVSSNSYSSGNLDFYSSDSKNGEYSISWYSPLQYNSVGFSFKPVKDLSELVTNNYSIGFWMKGDQGTSKFDLRFIDTKTGSEDHPWRMGYTFDFTNAVFDNQWHYVQVPLSSFTEFGSWDDDTYFNQIGLFDWSAVDKLEIVNEHDRLTDTNLWFDDIKIFDPSITEVNNSQLLLNSNYKLKQNYPNPFNPSTTINYSLPQNSFVSIVVYDLLGRVVKTLVSENKFKGSYNITFDASDLSSGVYYYTMRAGNFLESKKLLVLK